MASNYTREGIMAQVHAAFGQGTGPIRIAQQAMVFLDERYTPWVTQELLEQWETEGVQVLERIRAIGRLAADRATQRGQTSVQRTEVEEACKTVEGYSGTMWCPPDDDP